jgi:hypothetical protein
MVAHLLYVQLWHAIQGFADLSTSGRAHIGIKIAGQLDRKPFLNACRRRQSEGELQLDAAKLCSKWQEVKISNWHPIKVVEVAGKKPV